MADRFQSLSDSIGRSRRGYSIVLGTAFVLGTIAAVAFAERPGTHSLYPNLNNAPPGYVGALQLNRGPALAGYFQPVEINAPPWLLFAWADQGQFSEFRQAPVTLGLQVAPVYRFKVTGIPGNETAAVYPTIEVIDRLYPPPGQEAKFPIPIEITIEDLRLALSGQFVTRVIYVEDPDQALPIVSDKNRPQWFDAGPTANPLDEADKLGRPVAILRIGGRQPDERQGPDAQFLYGCPPLLIFGRPTPSQPGESAPLGADTFQARRQPALRR